MQILRKWVDSAEIAMCEIENTEFIFPHEYVFALFINNYGEDDYHLDALYTSEDAAKQALEFAINSSPNHTMAFIESMPLKRFHPGGVLRDMTK